MLLSTLDTSNWFHYGENALRQQLHRSNTALSYQVNWMKGMKLNEIQRTREPKFSVPTPSSQDKCLWVLGDNPIPNMNLRNPELLKSSSNFVMFVSDHEHENNGYVNFWILVTSSMPTQTENLKTTRMETGSLQIWIQYLRLVEQFLDQKNLKCRRNIFQHNGIVDWGVLIVCKDHPHEPFECGFLLVNYLRRRFPPNSGNLPRRYKCVANIEVTRPHGRSRPATTTTPITSNCNRRVELH